MPLNLWVALKALLEGSWEDLVSKNIFGVGIHNAVLYLTTGVIWDCRSVWKFRVFSTNCQRITMNCGGDNSELHRQKEQTGKMADSYDVQFAEKAEQENLALGSPTIEVGRGCSF